MASSSKWRALQRRHKWSYDALHVPAARLQTLRELLLQEGEANTSPSFTKFLGTLSDMALLTSTHAQLGALKKTTAAFLELVRSHASVEQKYSALLLLVEILFLENSVPLHRSLLSCLAQVPHEHLEDLSRAFRGCCEDYGLAGCRSRRFALAAVTSSLINFPKPGFFKELLETFSPIITETLSHGVKLLLKEGREGGRPAPSTMEECHSAMSCLYYMLQYFAHKLYIPCLRRPPMVSKILLVQSGHPESGGSGDEENPSSPFGSRVYNTTHSVGASIACKSDLRDVSVYHAAVDVILDVLQTGYLSRDCLIAAGVGLGAAAQLQTSCSDLAFMLANSLFTIPAMGLGILTYEGLKRPNSGEMRLEVTISELRGCTLAQEFEKFTDFGRLCVLRGLLTIVPRPALNMPLLYSGKHLMDKVGSVMERGQDDTVSVWTLLFDGILPSLCKLCESSVDSHFKFHSVTALQICLQQIRASITMEITNSALNELLCAVHDHGLVAQQYLPISDSSVCRILQIIWNNWEDPLNQTVKQIQVVFELLVDVQCLSLGGKLLNLSSQGVPVSKAESGSCKEERINRFLDDLATDLLSVGGHRKGRYVPLASLALRLGALNLLRVCPNLLFQTVNAMLDDDVCSSATAFLKSFLERLREECWSSEGGVMEGNIIFRRFCLPPIIAGLVSGNCRLRVNLNTYALPVALQIDNDGILPMLAFALDSMGAEVEGTISWLELEGSIGLPHQPTTNQRVALLVGLLKTARLLGLMEGDLCCSIEDLASFEGQRCGYDCSSSATAFVSIKRNKICIAVALLELAVTHSDDSLRIDAAEALCLNPKTATMPSCLELALLRVSIPLNMRCSSTSFRMKWTSLFKRFFMRVRTAMDRQCKLNLLRETGKDAVAGGSMSEDGHAVSMAVDLRQMYEFMDWFSQLLIFSIYPSAPYERKYMAMELIAAMLEVWSLVKLSDSSCLQSESPVLIESPKYFSCNDSFVSEGSTMIMMGAIVDSWDKLRLGAFKILVSYPSPLPGLETANGVEKVLKWVTCLVNSPRVRESDAGALLLQLMFQKYVIQLGWTLKLHPSPVVASSKSFREDERDLKIGLAIGEFVESLNDVLEHGIVDGEKDLLRACRHGFVHGVLLSLRYTMDELEWNSSSLSAGALHFQAALARLLRLLTRVTALALWVVSADALDITECGVGSPEMENLNLELSSGENEPRAVDDWAYSATGQEEDEEEVGFLAPGEQAIMVGCWLAMKEVSLLLGTVTRKVPLPGWNNGGMEGDSFPVVLLDVQQLELMGDHFLKVLLLMKHNGAIDKTRAGFVALCNRLLCSCDPQLNQMPELWLQQLMHHTAAEGQTVDDLLRRSAGIPAAFLALFLAEPEGAPKRLLFMAMKWLIDLAKSFLVGSHFGMGSFSKSRKACGTYTGEAIEMGESFAEVSKERDEGVVPTVHAFNVMRVTFNDTNLATDASGFCSEGLIIAIQAFSCHYWEVRNAANLAFTVLVRRMVGFMNSQKQESARRAITGFEFFHRYPALHPFLLEELRNATLQLERASGSGIGKGGVLTRALHPSLVPVLIILSRLQPSIINSSIDDWLSPSGFMSYVSTCATQSNLKVRILASRALAPLIAPDNLASVLHKLAKCLPVKKGTSITDDSAVKQYLGKSSSMVLGNDLETVAYSSGRIFSFNTLHGILLQMQFLLTSNCANLPLNSSIRKEIIYLLSPAMENVDNCSLACCPTVAATYLDVVHNLVEIEEICNSVDSSPVFWRIFIQTSATFLDDAYEKDSKDTLWDSTTLALRERTCKLYFRATLTRWPPYIMGGVASEGIADRDDESCDCEMANPLFGPDDFHKYGMTADNFLQRIKECMFDPMYEVRLGVLKVLKGFLDLTEVKIFATNPVKIIHCTMKWVVCCIQPMLMECLKVETHPRCIHYALLDYFTLCMLQVKILQTGQMGLEDMQLHNFQLNCSAPNLYWEFFDKNNRDSNVASLESWRLILGLFQTSKHAKTREVAICCLGLCIRQIWECIGNIIRPVPSTVFAGLQDFKPAYCEYWSAAKEPVYVWLELIQRHSAASEPVTLRRATAEAIVASGLLEHIKVYKSHDGGHCTFHESSTFDESTKEGILGRDKTQPIMGLDWFAGAVLDVWFICIKLLEDEDVDLRERLALAVLHVVSAVPSRQMEPAVGDFVPTQVERAIQLSFEFLTKHFGCSGIYLDCLASWVLKGVANMSVMQKDYDLVRHLFDKEVDNHHEESLLFAQFCCLHIDRVLKVKVKPFGSDWALKTGEDSETCCMNCLYEWLKKWRMKFLTHLRSFVERCLTVESRLQWLGGITNHPEVFRALYPLMLGLQTFTGFLDMATEDCCCCPRSDEEDMFLTELLELSKLIKPLLSNVLIFNLFMRVLERYEAQLCAQLRACSLQTLRESLFVKNFDPFFLLK